MSDYLTQREFTAAVVELAARLHPSALPKYKVKKESGTKGEAEVWLHFPDHSVSYRVAPEPTGTKNWVATGTFDLLSREAVNRYHAKASA